MKVPRQPLRLAPWEPSCRQFLPSDPSASYGINKAIQALHCVSSNLAVIKPESKLINIAAKVFLADLVVNAVNPPLHYSPNALNAVSAHAFEGILLGTVIDGLMAVNPVNPLVSGSFVSVDHRTRSNVFVNRSE